MDYFTLILILLLVIHIVYEYIYKTYIVIKNSIYNQDNFSSFLKELESYKVEFLVNNYVNKQYYLVYYRGYFIGYDTNKKLAVFPKPSKTSYKDIDNLYADLTKLNGSDIKIKEYKQY